MLNGIVSSHRCLIFLLTMTVATGCSEGPDQHYGAATGQAVAESSQPLKAHREGQRSALRTRTDTARGRIWVLSVDNDVLVYDRTGKELLHQIALPDWLVVETPCMPDLVLGRSGSVFVSSNVRPWIWEIDADTFEVRVHEVRMRGREHLDFGFATLAFAGNGTLYGLSPSAHSLWSIDVGNANANMIASYRPPLEECALAPHVLDRLGTKR